MENGIDGLIVVGALKELLRTTARNVGGSDGRDIDIYPSFLTRISLFQLLALRPTAE